MEHVFRDMSLCQAHIYIYKKYWFFSPTSEYQIKIYAHPWSTCKIFIVLSPPPHAHPIPPMNMNTYATVLFSLNPKRFSVVIMVEFGTWWTQILICISESCDHQLTRFMINIYQQTLVWQPQPWSIRIEPGEIQCNKTVVIMWLGVFAEHLPLIVVAILQ